MYENVENAVADVVVIGVFAFIAFERADGRYSQRQENDLVDGFQDKLEQQLIDQLRSGQDSQESNREEYQGIRGFSGQRTQYKTPGKLLPLRPDLHAAHDVGIHEASGKEGDE